MHPVASRLRLPLIRLALGAWLASACGPSADSVEVEASSTPTATSPAPVATASVGVAPSVTHRPDADLLVRDPEVLSTLEARGHAFTDALAGEGTTNAALLRTSALYRDLLASIEADDAVVRERDPRVGVGFRHDHRAFDTRWLASEEGRFELVGVVNRADRSHVDPSGCGEVRRVYRLAYTTPAVTSRLPMTVNVVSPQRGDCAAVARSWVALPAAGELAEALERGPFAFAGPVARVEINFQSARWPSAGRADLGGHAEYVLRVFRVEDGRLVRAPLENTPTVTMNVDKARELRGYLASRVEEVQRGTLILPDDFLAVRSVSSSPRGLARRSNRPFLQVFSEPRRSFGALHFEGGDALVSVDGFLRRLDTMSCKGCHQSRGLAGFHLLGEERSVDGRWNALAVGASPHLLAELPWRRRALEAMARGESFVEPRPFAERAAEAGRLGDTCGLGDPSYARWTCGEGLRCADLRGESVGACVPAEGPRPGDPVESGRVRPRNGAHDDLFVTRSVAACEGIDGGEAATARSKDGFPGGMCHAPCERFGEVRGGFVCGPVPFEGGQLFGGFNHCLFRLRRPFEECVADSSRPTWLRLCDDSRPCRDDFLCSRVSGLDPKQGACLPPYFLAQLRVDGHP